MAAFRALLERWFDSSVDVAWQVLHDADAAARVAEDTFFAAWHARAARKPPAEAGMWVLRASRDGALGRLAQARHQAPGSERWPSSGAPAVPGAPDRDAGADLLRASFAALGEADASVLDLHLRHGFGVPELAQALGVTRHDAQELVLRLNRRLGRALRAWALWPASRPGGAGPGGTGCPELRQALDANGARTFGPDAVSEIARHAKACERCQDAQRLADAPEAMYAAVPVVPAGTMLAAATAAALTARGIPLNAAAPAADPTSPDPSPATAAAPPPTEWAATAASPPAPTEWAAPAAAGEPAGGWAGQPTAADPAVHAGMPTVLATPPAVGPQPDTAWAPPGGTPYPAAGDGGSHFAATGATGSPGAEPKRGRRLIVALAVVAVLVLGAGAAYATLGGSDGDGTAGTTTSTSPSTTEDATTTVPTSTSTTTPGTTTTTAGTPGSTTTTAPGSTTTVTPSTTATTVATGEPPVIAGFDVASVTLGRPCADAERRITLRWSVSGADSVALAGEGAPAGPHPASGQATACRGSGPPVTYTLTATSAGGTDTATVAA